MLANAQAIPYELLGKIDMIGFGALDLMLGREPNGTLEKFYLLVDVALIVALVVMLRGHVRLAGPGASSPGRRRPAVGSDAWRGSRSTAISTCSSRSSCCFEHPSAFAAPWPVLVRTDIGLVLAVFIALRLTGGALRLTGWWRTGRRPVWTVVGGKVPPVATAG